MCHNPYSIYLHLSFSLSPRATSLGRIGIGIPLPTQEGKTSPQIPSHPIGAYGASIVAFGAPHLALSALGFMRPVFLVPIVGNPKCD